MTFDYKKYSLENLERWIEDAINSSEASPQEIYDVIKNVVRDNYYCYKNSAERCYELLALLNGNGKGHLSCDKAESGVKKNWKVVDKDCPYPIHISEDGDLWIPDSVTKEDKIVKWQLPVQVDGLTGDCFVQFPDDLLEAANLKEGDTVEWVDQKNGSFLLRKIVKPLEIDEC